MHSKTVLVFEYTATVKPINGLPVWWEPLDVTTTDDERRTFQIRIAHVHHIPLVSTKTVLVNSFASGLTYFPTNQNILKRHLALIAQF